MVILNLAVTGEIMDDPEPTGCQYYARNLINGLAADGQTKVTVIGSDRSRSDIFPSQVELVVHKPIRVGGTAFFSSLINPPSGLDRFDLIHCPTVIAPFFFKPKTPVVITVHDLIPILYPQHNTWRRNFYFKRLLKHRFSRADGFITVSESTKQDLIRLFGVGVDRIETVYEGVDSAFRPGPVEREDFILSVGTQEPRKNVQGLIRSFVRIKESNPTLAVRLKIVGRLGWLYDDIVKLHQRYGDYIDFLGYVPQKQLIDLYRRAMFFVFPSFYEGFGLPVLEAMACGCPVVCSNRSSLPEVGGRACRYIDPHDSNSLEQGLRALLFNPGYRDELSALGLERVRRFTWSACAARTKEFYSRLINN